MRKRTHCVSPSESGASHSRSANRPIRRRVSPVIGLVLSGFLLFLTACAAHADTYYLYDQNGTPIAVAVAMYQDHHIYDGLGNDCGLVMEDGRIVNAVGEQIGFVVASPNP
jgi:hypothetical protein